MVEPEGSLSEPLEFADGDAWEGWLSSHHGTAAEAWLRIGRKNADVPLISISDALDGALCFGWIDGQRRALDDVSFLQRYCPRRARSTWSQVNVEKAEALIASSRMRAPGYAEIDAAKADGRWDAAYVRQRDAEVPEDLASALSVDPAARAAFETLGRSEQYAVYLPMLKAVDAEARARALTRALRQLTASE